MTILVVTGSYEQMIRLLIQTGYQSSVFLHDGPTQYTFCEMPEEADFPLKKYTLYLKNEGDHFAYKVLNPCNKMVIDSLTKGDISGLERWFEEAPALTDIGSLSPHECKKIFEATSANGHTSPDNYYSLCKMPDDGATLEQNKLYLKKIDQVFQYKVWGPEGALLEGKLTASDVPGLDRWFKPIPPLEGIKNLSSLSYQILKLTCARGHTVKNEGEEAAYRQIVKDVTDRLTCLVDDKKDLEVLVGAWLRSQKSDTYIQGSADARIFSSSLTQWKNDLTPFILMTQNEESRSLSFRLTSRETGYAYLVSRTVEETLVEGGAVKQTVIEAPAAVSIFCKPSHPDIWIQFYMKPPAAQASVPLSQREVTILMPFSLGSPQILSAQTQGLSVRAVESLQDAGLDKIIENDKIRAIVESVFEGDVCCLERLALLDNRAAGFCYQHKHGQLSGGAEVYYNFQTLLTMLADVDVSGYRDVLLHAQQAAQALKDSPTFKENLASFHRAFVEWGASLVSAHFKEAVKTRQRLLQEFRHCCGIISEGVSIESAISADDVSRAMIFLAAQYPYYKDLADQYALCLLPETAKKITLEPSRIYLKFANTDKNSLVYYCLDPLGRNVTTNNIITLENLSAGTVFPGTLSQEWLNSIAPDLLRCLAAKRQIAQDAAFVKKIAESLLPLLQELKDSLPWVAEMRLDDHSSMVLPLDVFNTEKYPPRKPPYFLSEPVVAQARMFLIASAGFRPGLNTLSQKIADVSSVRDLKPDLSLPSAFLKHSEDIIKAGNLESSHKALRFIITHYSTWYSMTRNITYAEEIRGVAAKLLAILREALVAREELRDGRVVLDELLDSKLRRFKDKTGVEPSEYRFHRLPKRRTADDSALPKGRWNPVMQ